MTQGTMATHHANDRMRCAYDGEEWPCIAFIVAREEAERRGKMRPDLVIDVEQWHEAHHP